MKVLKEGTSESLWWVGVEVVCRECGRVVQLEKADRHLATVAIMPDSVTVWCEVCATATIVTRTNLQTKMAKGSGS